eukprot:1282464-Prymnesium_polylepis.1
MYGPRERYGLVTEHAHDERKPKRQLSEMRHPHPGACPHYNLKQPLSGLLCRLVSQFVCSSQFSSLKTRDQPRPLRLRTIGCAPPSHSGRAVRTCAAA